MDKAARLRLKEFLADNIPFSVLKEAGFWPAGTRKTDYEKIAARICWFFSIKSIYDYEKLLPRPGIDGKCPTNWPPLKTPEYTELVSQEKYLN
jgi:hypothetical protein